MKKLFAVLASVMFILSACQKGPKPEESLVAAGNAVVNLDVENIDKYIDITSILKNALEVVKQKDIGLDKEDMEQWAISIPMAEPYLFKLITELKKEEPQIAIMVSGYIKMLKVSKYEIISNKKGVAKAKVTIDISDLTKLFSREASELNIKDNEINLVFEMKQKDTYWEIVSLANLEELISGFVLKEYSKSVEKARASEALSLFGAIAGAEQRYYLVRDKYTNNFDDLDLEFQDEFGNTVSNTSTLKTKNFEITLKGSGQNNWVEAVRRSDTHKYIMAKKYDTGRISCVQEDGGTDFCRSVGHFDEILPD